jgi:hypothetical protein
MELGSAKNSEYGGWGVYVKSCKNVCTFPNFKIFITDALIYVSTDSLINIKITIYWYFLDYGHIHYLLTYLLT